MSWAKIHAPIRKRMMMVFDVETTGLLPKKKKGEELSIESYPYIVQLSFVLYDLFESRAVKIYDAYVKIPENIEITSNITALTGITREICNEKGKNIVDILSDFYDAYMLAEVIIAHNIEFDEKMINVELQRNRNEIMEKAPYCFTIFSKIYETCKGVERYCTMRNGMEVCAVREENKVIKKWPKLIELYKKLFDEVPDGLHNSMVDVNACLRCYLKMRHGIICS
jgi:DNA polymerase III epsilon subunit-like protein